VSGEQGLPDADVLVALNRATVTAKLLSGVVHEVNNALQVIAGSVELLEQQPGLAAATVRSLDRIKRQGERAASALADLQRFTKAPAESRERFNLREAVEHAVGLRRYAASRVGLSFELEASGTASDLATGNVGACQQAVLNLLANAEQAMAGASGTIRIRLCHEPGRIGVAVVDEGHGIPGEHAAATGRPFTTSGRATDGAGLGLFATRTIAESQGGRLDITSTPGGTTATVWLPTG
jgi:two-component system OmpR family sensor kinase